MNMRHWSMKWLLMLMAATMVAVAQDLSFEGLLKDGIRYYKKGDYKTAAEKFEDAGKLQPDDARVKYNEALSRYMNKDYEKACEGFQTAKEKGYAEGDKFKAACELAMGNCHYQDCLQKKSEATDKPPQEAVKQLTEAKDSCEKSIDSYKDALRYSQKLKNAQDNLKTARNQRKELVKTLRKLEEELKQQPQQQQDDQKQDGEKQDGEQQQQDAQKQDGEKQDGEQQQQQGEQQQKDAGEQLEELAKRQSQEAEKNEQGQQNQQQATDEQKKLNDETEQMRQAMEQQRKDAEKQDGQSSEKSEAEKKLEEAQDAQKKAEESLEKGDMKSASEAQKEAAEKLDEAKQAMSKGEKKDQEEQQQQQQQQQQVEQQEQQDDSEEQGKSETENEIQDILDQERNNQRKRLKLLRIKPVEKDW
jgi:hypothetical protein